MTCPSKCKKCSFENGIRKSNGTKTHLPHVTSEDGKLIHLPKSPPNRKENSYSILNNNDAFFMVKSTGAVK
jgi:hypothetical protein